MGLTRAPMMKDAQIGTKPAPGVMATRPTTRPVEAPTSVGLPDLITSIAIQDKSAAAAEMAEVIKACAASPSAFKALPALKPNHPNQRREAPRTTNGILWIRYVVCS